MIRKTIAILLLCFVYISGFSQAKSIKIEANKQALNQVLLQLRDQYGYQFSYNDSELSKYKVSVSKSFDSKDEALQYLIKDLPLEVKKLDNVYIIVPIKETEKKAKPEKTTRITGQIVEAGTYEPLPFSHILINNQQMVSDVMGSFNYIASADSSFHVRISHLGYYIYDTVLVATTNHKFTLIPSSEKLSEIVVQNNIIEKSTLIGENPGKIKLNHNISRFLPGQGDNSVFNLLRLMPGVQAAGEQSTDLLIWGSYEGQSQITFDEYTIFGLKNYNDNISVVNPFLVKNIEIYKGGYEAKYGNRVGGIVNITGKNGNMLKPSLSLSINPTTLNGLVELPLFKKSSLMLAYRQTYYNLYNSDDFNIYAPTRPMPKNAMDTPSRKPVKFDINVYPDDYSFSDLNLKYSVQFDNGDLFYISTYKGGDFFSLTANAEFEEGMKGRNGNNRNSPIEVSIKNTEKNSQLGSSVFYGKTWKNGTNTHLILSHSDFKRTLSDLIEGINPSNQKVVKTDSSSIQNDAIENNLRIENNRILKNGTRIEFGGGVYLNSALIINKASFTDTVRIDSISNFSNQRAFAYFQNTRHIGGRLKVNAGLRMNFLINAQRYFLEPRLSSSYNINDKLKFNASWGLYNQFMYKIANVDVDNNYNYLWITSNQKTPPLKATHWVAGLNYFNKNFTINVEGYYKQIDNLSQRTFESRQVNDKRENRYYLLHGEARTYGIDTYIKKDFGHNSIWASYTLSKALERLAPDGRPLPDYGPAPHDQRHEFKIAGILNYKKFYFSANYVYGSGMDIIRKVFDDPDTNISYNRFDAALTYKFDSKHFNGETGLSVLNVFDTQNLKYANLRNIHINNEIGSVSVYSDAVPFTPILFLKLVF